MREAEAEKCTTFHLAARWTMYLTVVAETVGQVQVQHRQRRTPEAEEWVAVLRVPFALENRQKGRKKGLG